jgi:hypothetical protein
VFEVVKGVGGLVLPRSPPRSQDSPACFSLEPTPQFSEQPVWIAHAATFETAGLALRGRGLAHKLRDHRSEVKQRHRRNDAERNHTIDAPDQENVGLDVGKVEREGKSAKGGHKKQAIETKKSEDAHEDVSHDADGGDGDGPKHGVGAVIDDAAVPVVVDAARGVSILAVVLAEGEGRGDDAEQREDEECVFHRFYDLNAALKRRSSTVVPDVWGDSQIPPPYMLRTHSDAAVVTAPVASFIRSEICQSAP